MNEHAPKKHNLDPHNHEKLVDSSHERRVHKSHETAAEKASHEHQKNINQLETIRKSIENKAKSSESIDLKQDQAQEKKHDFVGASIKGTTLNRSLTSIRKNLSSPEAQFSKVIHNQTVDQISEIGGKTVARPSGLLFGGAFALLTNLLVMIICRYFGYEYNYFIGMAAFVIGFGAGLIVETLLKLKRVKPRHHR